MKKTFWIFCLIALCNPSFGEEVKVLPEDGGKWYVSVIGVAGEKQYEAMVTWFDEGDLKTLKDQVHFNQVTTDSPMFEHYAVSKHKLPIVRVQTANGSVIYEASGQQIPWTGQTLYGAIATADVERRQKRQERREERQNDESDKDKDKEKPIFKPLIPDPPAQPLNNGGSPAFKAFEAFKDFLFTVMLCILAVLVGCWIGLWKLKGKDQ